MKSDVARRPWPDFRTVWRWHFYAGLFCIPFVVFLSITGAIYLFRPQIDTLLDRPYNHFHFQGAPQPPSAEAMVAVKAVPGSVLTYYQIPIRRSAAAQVVVGRAGKEFRVYVNPKSLKVLKLIPDESRPMRVLFNLHGALLLGTTGSMIVELAAGWTIVMILSGLYLWWPRHSLSLAGVVYPRLRLGKRFFWRDIHAVTGMGVSFFALFLLVSGLPWASNWGAYLQEVRTLIGVTAPPDWSTVTGRARELANLKNQRAIEVAMRTPAKGGEGDSQQMAGMVMPAMPAKAGAGDSQQMAGMVMPAMPVAIAPTSSHAYDALNRLVPVVAALHLPYPVRVTPPTKVGGPWNARSDAQDRPLRVELTLDPSMGTVLTRKGFAQQARVDRIVAVGVAAHEGRLFGWPNVLLGVLTAIGLVLMCIGAVVLWWRRRPDGVLGAPAPTSHPRFSSLLAAIVIALGIFMPELGVCMLAVALIERLVLKRIPVVRTWLGLYPPKSGSQAHSA